jgi:DNA-binding transcriptional regulator GbsR (MarR family)
LGKAGLGRWKADMAAARADLRSLSTPSGGAIAIRHPIAEQPRCKAHRVIYHLGVNAMEQAYLDKAENYPGLGPHYFAARDAVEQFMAKFEPEHFAPLLKKFTDSFYEQMLESLQASLMFDLESNLQSHLWRGIDDSVKALMTGERWALERYALGERWDHEKIREAVAKHIPAELQDARIKDLEAEVDRLRKDAEFYKRR